MEQPRIAGIAFNRDEAQITVQGVPDQPGMASQILGAVGEANVEVDMIVQNTGSDDSTDLTFTVHRNEYQRAMELVKPIAESLKARHVGGNTEIVKVSLVGVGMRSHAGIAAKMFKVLADDNINIHMISTSEIKISVVIEERYMELAVRALHEAFDLADEARI